MGWKWNDKATNVKPPEPTVSNAQIVGATVGTDGTIVLTVQTTVTWGESKK